MTILTSNELRGDFYGCETVSITRGKKKCGKTARCYDVFEKRLSTESSESHGRLSVAE
jgi:hypothetical protein